MERIKAADFNVGSIHKYFDEEDMNWYKVKVIKVNEGSITLKDIDPDSDFKGMEWDSDEDELNNKKVFKL